MSLWLFWPDAALAQHLGIAQLLEVFREPAERRGTILKANGFAFQTSYAAGQTTCFRYGRLQPDVYGDAYEETITYCATGSLSYATFSPDHATNLKFQLMRKFDFRDMGAFTSPAGLLKNLYQRRGMKVETANTKDGRGEEMWLFQFYEDQTLADTAPLARVDTTQGREETVRKNLKGNFYALLIGINEYQDRRIPDLSFPLSDVGQLSQVLNQRYNFSERRTTILTNPTRKAILRAFDELVYQLQKDDNLLIFFAGHGRQDEKSQQGYWLPSDAENEYNDDWLSNSTIRDQLRRFSCQHILVISDACFSGELISTRGERPTRAIEQLYGRRSRRAITSSGNTVVPDRSVFVNFLVKRLRENNRAFLPASDLFVSMREAVINNSSLDQVPMYGHIQQAGDEGGEFIFIRKSP